MRTFDPADEDVSDLEPLRDIVGDARVVALGESMHRVHEFSQLRDRVLRFLVSELGFSAFVMESGFPEGLAVNDWVRGGPGDLTHLLNHGITYHMSKCVEMRMAENVEWILQREDRIVIAAANGHVQRWPYSAPPIVNDALTTVGQHLATSLGAQMVVIGTGFGGGKLWLHRPPPGAPPGHTEPFVGETGAPEPHSLDALLAGTGLPRYILDLRKVPSDGPVAERFAATNATMNGPHPQPVDPMAAFDAVVFADTITPWHTFIDTPP